MTEERQDGRFGSPGGDERTAGTPAVSATYRMGPGFALVVDLGLVHCPETIRVLPKQILGVWGQSPQCWPAFKRFESIRPISSRHTAINPFERC